MISKLMSIIFKAVKAAKPYPPEPGTPIQTADHMCPKCMGFLVTKDDKYSACSCGTTIVSKGPITLTNYLTASGAYPDRANHEELTSDYKINALKLITRVNLLLNELRVSEARVTSGFRPRASNEATGGAQLSAHMSCEAIDILDDMGQTLAKRITQDLLNKYDLYREDYDFTKGQYTNWVHLQTRKTRSGKRIFKP